jgi:adenylate cyclase
MAEGQVQRRLAAILAADVVGYSRLIRADEEGTLAALKLLRADVIDPRIAGHNGRVVKLMGDGMLAEFASVVDAVRAAVETQRAVAQRNAALPTEKHIEFRVGINLGDVVIDGDDIHGGGVNVASRLEGLADPGGICISGGVHDQVRDRIDQAFDDLGDQQIKNIDRPVRVWRWKGESNKGAGALAEPLPLPDKPSIAVLPFDNMSGDPEQEYFSDGLAEDIITALSKVAQMRVIARNSTFAYKGQALDLRRIAGELGVRYLLEGSVRRGGDRLRITAQLIGRPPADHRSVDRC